MFCNLDDILRKKPIFSKILSLENLSFIYSLKKTASLILKNMKKDKKDLKIDPKNPVEKIN